MIKNETLKKQINEQLSNTASATSKYVFGLFTIGFKFAPNEWTPGHIQAACFSALIMGSV